MDNLYFFSYIYQCKLNGVYKSIPSKKTNTATEGKSENKTSGTPKKDGVKEHSGQIIPMDPVVPPKKIQL